MFGTGDYFETFSPSERASIVSANKGYGLHDTSLETIDDLVKGQADEFVESLLPIKESILGLGQGHHYYDFQYNDRGMTTDQYMAERLEAEYYGFLFLLDFLINGLPFKVLATHGYGTARTIGARIIKRIRMSETYLNANWYVMGHDNEKFVTSREPFISDGQSSDGIDYFKQYFSGVGSFQRGYNIGDARSTYVERAMYPPAALGVVICIIKLEERNGRPRLDYHVSV